MPSAPTGRSSVPPLMPVTDEITRARGAEEQAIWADTRVPLRVAVTRGALGLELYESVFIGPLEVCGLALTLPGLRFPLDLSGGVPVFRNRRGELERLELRFSLDLLARWLEPRMKDLVGGLQRPLALWCAPPMLGIGLVGSACALAFELLWAPSDQKARLIVANARGIGLAAPALALALRAVDSALTPLGKRHGRILEIDDVALRVGRALMPAVGARAPAAARVRFGPMQAKGDKLELELDSSFGPAAASVDVTRAYELAELVSEADDALASGELDAARSSYLFALEQAPRHPDITRLIAEIDVTVGGRAEAALGLINESMPAVQGGSAAASLLAVLGDLDAARQTLREMARVEPYGPLSALLWQRLAALEEPPERLAALDRAVARSPALPSVYWGRFAARVERRDVDGALADAEHLEALAVGAKARHEVLRRAAAELLQAGFEKDAGKLFERALRYVPDDATATAGLARSFMQTGRTDRAVTLLERAIQLGERAGRAEPEALLDLAKLLASAFRDLPQAIARTRQVPASARCAVEARGLEARWRAALGDVVGASLSYARMREAIELTEELRAASIEWLLEAAHFERDVSRDALAAERHLTVALRLAPHEARVLSAYRDVAAIVAARARKLREERS